MNNIFLPRGRMRRLYYWPMALILTLPAGILGKFIGIILSADELRLTDLGYAGPIIAASALWFWLSLIIGIKRAHDIGSIRYARLWCMACLTIAAGAWADHGKEPGEQPIIAVAIAISLLILVVLNLLFLFSSGQIGRNEFGDDPRKRRVVQNA